MDLNIWLDKPFNENPYPPPKAGIQVILFKTQEKPTQSQGNQENKPKRKIFRTLIVLQCLNKSTICSKSVTEIELQIIIPYRLQIGG